MKIIVQFSGGKDSHAALLWAVHRYGAKNIQAVFCDTGWEHPLTYTHIQNVVKKLGVSLRTLTSKKYTNFIDLVRKKKRFPSTKARFCTQELKVKPFVDYILDEIKDHFIAVQGIRKDESKARSKMTSMCRHFKFYLEPYGYNKEGKPKFHTYRKKEVLEYIQKYDDSILRPMFKWTAQDTIDFILTNGHLPNPLYSKGFSRVGCFPCIQCSHNEVKQILKFYPNRIKELEAYEKELQTYFFPPDYIPKRFCSQSAIVKKGANKGKTVAYPNTTDVTHYIENKNATGDLFEQERPISCLSYYALCE
ncbi:phosphoadenosine phosphosulfate reductase domain-containing protein [Aquimarina algicola]|uniref:Phosphoadenosine phosphosulfate reductase family protein n=1 Tax=Aquimarina algicola TaxID=2589995 RepID=A0A504J4U7_9FLAO|nr:phosphoadenosine phosphosulfate reductase family protein [Aquimarina algicola]TPN82928.1 phosphoadenosine phosphosulfate reductase family protein [Aquimarina algicola]